MSSIITKSPVKMASFDAVIIKADGTRVDLGTIAYYHKNPLRRAWHSIKTFFKHKRQA